MTSIQIAILTSTDQQTQLKCTQGIYDAITIDWFHDPLQIKENITDRYDIFLIDAEFAGENLQDIVETLLQTTSYTKVIVICPQPDGSLARTLMRLGVTGILLQDDLSKRFAYFIRIVHSGQIVISPAILKELLILDVPSSKNQSTSR